MIAQVEAWIRRDPDPDTRAELEALLAAGDTAELEARFEKRLAFGTAGLRGVLGAAVADHLHGGPREPATVDEAGVV